MADYLNAAYLSPCRQYRYILHRTVSMVGDKTYAYFGINPSVADEHRDDRTLSRLIDFTKSYGGKDLLLGNVFAYRSTDVKALANVADPCGPCNNDAIQTIINASDILIACWCNKHKIPRQLHDHITKLTQKLIDTVRPLYVFGTTGSGDPKHPLYLPKTTTLTVYQNHNTKLLLNKSQQSNQSIQ